MHSHMSYQTFNVVSLDAIFGWNGEIKVVRIRWCSIKRFVFGTYFKSNRAFSSTEIGNI